MFLIVKPNAQEREREEKGNDGLVMIMKHSTFSRLFSSSLFLVSSGRFHSSSSLLGTEEVISTHHKNLYIKFYWR